MAPIGEARLSGSSPSQDNQVNFQGDAGMNFKHAFAASVSVAALAASTLAATAQTDLTALYDAAKAEGTLTTIALPYDWCGYGAVIDVFKAKYPGITVNELNPDAG